jgi:hypothetical protein
MKVIACIFAILSGIFGLFGATAQGVFGPGISVLTHSDEIANNGATLFYLSWIVIILGGVSLRFPNICGIGLVLISIIAFFLGNIFSAPFAFIGGIFGLFAQQANNNKEFRDPVASSESGIPDHSSSVIRGNNNPNSYSSDKSTLLNQLSQLHSLKENNVITEEIYEQERLAILSKFQQQPIENSGKDLSQVGDNGDAITIQDPIHQEEYDPVYEELFNKNWLDRNRKAFIISLLIIGLVISLLLFYRKINFQNNNFVSQAAGIYIIRQGDACGINEGDLRINKFERNKFEFELAVAGIKNNEGNTMVGRIQGTAIIAGDNLAIFKDESCDSLTFTFLSENRIEIVEKGCSYNHGAGICFDGLYKKD